MKALIFTLTLMFSFFSQAGTKAPDCMWTDSSYASAAFYSKSMKASKGWIFCEKANLTSVVLERYRKSSRQWIKKFVRESIPDAKSTIEKSIKAMTFGGQRVKRIVVQVSATYETYDMVFYFLAKSKRKYVFSAILLERPYGTDLLIATREVEKVIKNQPELFKD